jgi:release factor glutamine methyltransferase
MTGVPSREAIPDGTFTSSLAGSTHQPQQSWRDHYDHARGRLRSDVEARWLVEEASGFPWADIAGGAPRVTQAGLARFNSMLDRRAAGEPLQYVIGHWSFRTLDLMVDHRVLIPRPETEQVVEVALGELDRTGGEGASKKLVAVDLGTGSGAIALSIAAERQGVHVWATDSSNDALDVASANLAGLGGFRATRVRLAQGSWWSALPDEIKGRVDLVVSNPPYVSSREMATLDPTVRDWEPVAALESGPTGLEAIEAILSGAADWLASGGSAVLEIAPHQADDAIRLARDTGFAAAHAARDLAGRERVLVARTESGAAR